jgi:hypothetical protein
MEMLIEQILSGQTDSEETSMTAFELSELELSLVGGGIGDVQI